MTISTRKLNIQYDENETISRCRMCGYVLTDQEKIASGPCGPEGNYYCVFCSISSFRGWPSKWQLFYWATFKRADLKIHRLKEQIRESVYINDRCFRLSREIGILVQQHHAEVFPFKYSEEKNEYQIRHEQLIQELKEFRDTARIAYYDSLAHFGDASDQPPCTRNLSKSQKRKLISFLKNELLNIKRRNWFIENGEAVT